MALLFCFFLGLGLSSFFLMGSVCRAWGLGSRVWRLGFWDSDPRSLGESVFQGAGRVSISEA